MAFDRRLNELKQELETNNRVPEHEKLYLKYFTCTTTPKRGTKVTVNEYEIIKAKRYFGFFSLIQMRRWMRLLLSKSTEIRMLWKKHLEISRKD
jgi:hypothetical protein